MVTPSVLVTTAGSITTVTINRPEARNCLNSHTVAELSKAFDALSANTRCVILHGSGTEAFCAGADIHELVKNPSPQWRRSFFESIASLIEKIQTCHAPVIASVRGYALAGGCGLAAACDITVASDDAVFGLPEAGVGLAALVVMAPLSRVLQKKTLARLLLTAERITANEAKEAGLVSIVTPQTSLEAEVAAIAAKVITLGPEALKASKAALLEVNEHDYLPFLRELADRSALLSLGKEASEGLSAFTEKRSPTWKKTP